MANHRVYWTEVGREASTLAGRGAAWLRGADAATRVVIGVVAFLGGLAFLGGAFTLVFAVSSFASGIVSGGSLAVAPEGEVPEYTIWSQSEALADLDYDYTFTVETDAYGEDDFRLIAEDLRHRHPEHGLIFVLFMHSSAATGFESVRAGMARAAISEDKLDRGWLDLHPDYNMGVSLERGVLIFLEHPTEEREAG